MQAFAGPQCERSGVTVDDSMENQDLLGFGFWLYG